MKTPGKVRRDKEGQLSPRREEEGFTEASKTKVSWQMASFATLKTPYSVQVNANTHQTTSTPVQKTGFNQIPCPNRSNAGLENGSSKISS